MIQVSDPVPFKWCFAGLRNTGSFVIFQGIWTSIAKELYMFVIFHGGPDSLSPLCIRSWTWYGLGSLGWSVLGDGGIS